MTMEKLLTDPEDILKRWHEYGKRLFNMEPTPIETLSTNEIDVEEEEPEPLVEEVKAALKNLKPRKSPGLDNVPAKLLKFSGEASVKALHQLCCKIWKTNEWPTDLKTQEFVMLHKSGNVKYCNNYRTISFIAHASKILLIIILNRMKQKVEFELSDCQAGYRTNRGTTDMLFVIQHLIEKIRDTNEEMYITFIDYSKAFDSVIHQHLFKTMEKLGFPKHTISLISSLYKDQRGTIRWDSQNCQFFNITKGVRQGCILSPHLFSLYTEQIMREADIDNMGLKIGGRNISNLRYADDTALVADNNTSMKRILHRVDAAGRTAGLKLNAKKTKVLHVPSPNQQGHTDIKVDKIPLEKVNEFKYLGSIKTNNGTCTKDIKVRIAMAKNKMLQLNNIWKDHSLPIHLKMKLLECLVWPVMLYGCETWTQKKEDNKRIEAAEMWFYRRLLRVSWKDKKTNESILEELGTSRRLLSLVSKRKLKYAGHAIRNEKTSLMKIALQGKTEGKRKRGRPAATLMSNLTEASGCSLHEISRRCLDREQWRRKCLAVCPSEAANTDPGDADR